MALPARPLPFVSCVCPTTPARANFLVKALACYEYQTYKNKELVIAIEEGSEVPLDRDLPSSARIVHTPRGITLGEKRNAVNLAARGSVIAHWDDDDWSCSLRLTEQVDLLLETGATMVGMSQMKFTDGVSWYRYIGDKSWPLGTSLVYWRDWWESNRFLDRQVGTDTDFILAARMKCQVAVEPTGDRMFARVHAGSTSIKPMLNINTYERLADSEAIFA